MCLDEDAGLTHSCVEDCLACYVFTLGNLQGIAEGGRIELGTLTELLAIAEQGCNFCKFLVNVAIQSGKPFKEDAKVEITPVESYEKSPDLLSDQIDQISIKVADPFTFGFGGRGGFQQEVFNQFSVSLGIYTESSDLKRIVPKAPASPKVATSEVFDEVGAWITACVNDHAQCPDIIDSQLPTRVLDVGVDSDSPSDEIKLHISTKGECHRYAALSYCWGSGTQTKTLQQNLEQHMQSIKVMNLPQTIQDAIHVTRELKIRYLWVDALCIIQDLSKDKWEQEAAQMPQIYKNAMVTISAAAAVGTDQGFLQDRQSISLARLQSSRFPVYKPVSDDENGDEENENSANFVLAGEVFISQDDNLGYGVKDFDDEVINSRAWTLQESWLSPRLLIFGSGLPQWKCLEHERTYGVEQPKQRYDWDKKDKTRSQIFHSNNPEAVVSNHYDRVDYLQEWWSLFTNYSRRKLTFKTDKMAAISGIAQEFQGLLKDQYVAGLWKSSLPESLLWRHENEGQGDVAQQEKTRKRDKFRALFSFSSSSHGVSPPAEPYIAPSWSPFANNESVQMSYPSHSELPTLATIDKVDLQPANDLAPYLAVKPGHGQLNITAPMTQMSYEEIISYFVIVIDGSPHIYWDWIVPDGGAVNMYLGPAGKLQMQYPEINPQVIVDGQITNMIGPPLVQETLHRPTPPDATLDHSWPKPASSRRGRHSRGNPDADFWLLEIGHTDIPTGLVLIRLRDSEFRRIGMFRMGRNQNPNRQWVNGYEIAGPRRWDWDARLEMRTCSIS
ncbi:HET-domain-containing protein [Thozetella sp. PMI_491]|nr:HET-domain-containing protein [Thozetella sp. PMI_491]